MSKGKAEIRQRRRNGGVDAPNLHRRIKRKNDHSGSGLNESGKSSIFMSFVMASVIVAFGIIGLQVYQQRLRSRVRTTLSVPQVLGENATAAHLSPELYWGSYRPQLYFGMRHRSPHSILAGLLWFQQGQLPPKIRHWCNPGDGLKSYSWLYHDGHNFGQQQIIDDSHIINTTFVKRPSGRYGGDWTARISVAPKIKAESNVPVSLVFYFLLPDSTKGHMFPEIEGNELKGIRGETNELGSFRVSFLRSSARPKSIVQVSYLGGHAPREDKIQDALVQGMTIGPGGSRIGLLGRLPLPPDSPENLIAYEATGSGSWQLEVVFESEDEDRLGEREQRTRLAGSQFDAEVARHTTAFHDNFDRVFRLDKKRFSEKQVNLAKSVFSNLMGGVGYFYGSSVVTSEYLTPDAVEYWPASLFTATPSRSQFPRGFLWDEGFHQLVLARWDPQLTLDALGHWLDLVNTDGWIPREQILGWEARAKVPPEFIVQSSWNGNPPTLVLPLEDILDRLEGEDLNRHRHFFERAFPRLEAWFNWFNGTQSGPLPTSYRWRGREENNPRQLNPLTLTSGLDDYPRASHPNNDERHLDLRCWMAVFSRVMARIGRLIAAPDNQVDRYQFWADQLRDESLLNSLHWSDQRQQYADYGFHTDKVSLVRAQPPPAPPGQRQQQQVKPEKVRQVRETPRLQYVPSFGYVSLFPLLLRLLPADSPKLGKLLDDLGEEKLLWTKHGLRSLAHSAALYQRHNTEHDPPYWRGAVWLNMNYLAVRALKHYSTVEGPNRGLAGQLHDRLRDNLVRNVLGQLEETGYLWEQYDDMTGKGQRAHPFSGWTSLIVLVMADK